MQAVQSALFKTGYGQNSVVNAFCNLFDLFSKQIASQAEAVLPTRLYALIPPGHVRYSFLCAILSVAVLGKIIVYLCSRSRGRLEKKEGEQLFLETVPQEIWKEIIRKCSPKTRYSLNLVSRDFHDLVRKLFILSVDRNYELFLPQPKGLRAHCFAVWGKEIAVGYRSTNNPETNSIIIYNLRDLSIKERFPIKSNSFNEVQINEHFLLISSVKKTRECFSRNGNQPLNVIENAGLGLHDPSTYICLVGKVLYTMTCEGSFSSLTKNTLYRFAIYNSKGERIYFCEDSFPSPMIGWEAQDGRMACLFSQGFCIFDFSQEQALSYRNFCSGWVIPLNTPKEFVVSLDGSGCAIFEEKEIKVKSVRNKNLDKCYGLKRVSLVEVAVDQEYIYGTLYDGIMLWEREKEIDWRRSIIVKTEFRSSISGRCQREGSFLYAHVLDKGIVRWRLNADPVRPVSWNWIKSFIPNILIEWHTRALHTRQLNEYMQHAQSVAL